MGMTQEQKKERNKTFWEGYSESKRKRIEKKIEKAKEKGKDKKARQLSRKLGRKEKKWADKIERGAKRADKRSGWKRMADAVTKADFIGKGLGVHKALKFDKTYEQDASDKFSRGWTPYGDLEDILSGGADGEVGSAVGGGGLYGGDQFAQTLSELQSQVQGFGDQAQQYRDAASGGTDFMQMLQQAANGEVPSAAELQMQQALQQQNALNLGAARSAIGANPALAMQMAMRANERGGQQTAMNASILRAQEQAQARQQLAEMTMKYEQMGYDAQQAQMMAQADLLRMQQQESQFGRGLAQQGELAKLGMRTQLTMQQRGQDFAAANQPTFLESAAGPVLGAVTSGIIGGSGGGGGETASAGGNTANTTGLGPTGYANNMPEPLG